MKFYRAPWSTLLVVVSTLVSLLLIGIVVPTLLTVDHHRHSPWALLPLAILIGCACFTIRGFTVTKDAVLVHRLFWETYLPRKDLQSAHFEPDAMRASLRLFGNGGLFSFSGLYRNRSLGNYRAFVTDQHRTVVLRFPQRTIVLSPEDPEGFVKSVMA